MFTDLGDAIVDYLNDPGRGFSKTFTAQRVNTPIWQLEKIQSLTVEVFPSLESRARSTRESWVIQRSMTILIRDKIGTLDDTDGLLAFVDELKEELCKTGDLSGYSLATIEDAEPFSLEQYVTERVFMHPVTATFTGLSVIS